MKLVILLVLIAVFASLAAGLYFLSKDNQGSPRMLNALKVRVGLSVLLITLLVVSYFAGWLGQSPPA